MGKVRAVCAIGHIPIYQSAWPRILIMILYIYVCIIIIAVILYAGRASGLVESRHVCMCVCKCNQSAIAAVKWNRFHYYYIFQHFFFSVLCFATDHVIRREASRSGDD